MLGRDAAATSSDVGTSFGDGNDLIDEGSQDLLFFTIGPDDFQLVDLGGGGEAEVEAGIGAGCVTTAGEDVCALANAVNGEEDFGADGVAGRLEAGNWRRRLCNQFQTEPVVGGLGYIAEKRGSGIDVI